MNEYGPFLSKISKKINAFAASKGGSNPLVAFLCGFALGPIGLGIYLRSWLDFLIPLAFAILGATLTPDVPDLVFWVLHGVYGAVRAAMRRESDSRNTARAESGSVSHG